MHLERNSIFVAIFAIAMAYIESAVVVYLRAFYGIEDLMKDINFTPDKYTFIEIGREAATLIMLTAAGLIAGKSKSQKTGYVLFAFGIWDIFYYIWLFVFIEWPKSLLEWDILFLIPLPWWAPVIAPVLISALMILEGYVLITKIIYKITIPDWIILALSILILLYTFMEDSIKVILTGIGDLTKLLPSGFNWLLFAAGYAGLILVCIRIFYLNRKNLQLNSGSD
jgi:hypothetical protein